jgi:diguanylate cyclase (GGDEF)-like protein
MLSADRGQHATAGTQGMSITGDWKRDLLRTLFARPDEVMLDLGAGGELLVARVRATLSVLALLLVPVAMIGNQGAGSVTEFVIGLGASVFINLCAQIWLALALLHLGDPVAPFNSMIVWTFYLISISMTALRNDGRLTLYAGALSIVQNSLLVTLLYIAADAPEQLVSVDYGSVSLGSQVERQVLLLMMTVLTATVVFRMQRLIESSGSDGLTGLPNRAWLVQRMPRVLETVREEGTSLTLALLDLDDFKRVNVAYGHLAGDRAIRHIAGSMREMLQPKERLIRIGGQEFVLLLNCPIGNAWERLDRLRQLMLERPFVPERGGDPLKITFSGGLSSYPADGSDVSSLLRSADRRLQVAKREGCNRVIARDT